MEQKNFDAVRKLVGYALFSTPQALNALNKLYRVQGLLLNYIFPTQKLIEKTRKGSKYITKYDKPKTPAMRLLEHPDVDPDEKATVRETLNNINSVTIALKVKQLQRELYEMADKNLSLPYPQREGA